MITNLICHLKKKWVGLVSTMPPKAEFSAIPLITLSRELSQVIKEIS